MKQKRSMTSDEIRYMTEIAGNTFEKDKSQFYNLTSKQLFIKAFLLGREFTLDELGCLDPDVNEIFEDMDD